MYVRWSGHGNFLAVGSQQKRTLWNTVGAGEHKNDTDIFTLSVSFPHRLNGMSDQELVEANIHRGFSKHLLTWSVAA